MSEYFIPKEQSEYANLAKKMIEELEGKAIEREELIRLTVLAIFSRTNVVLIGPPGVGKTYLINIIIRSIEGAKSFEYLIMTHTKPEELFGTSWVDSDGKMHYDTENSLLDSHFPFLDEIFKGRSDILNTLLGITHPSRKFFMRGVGEFKVPMVCMFAASNELPADESLDALDDRFLIRYEVLPIRKIENYDRYLKGDYDTSPTLSFTLTLDDLKYVYDISKRIVMPPNVRKLYSYLRERMIRNRVKVSDRKINLALDIFKVSAYLNGRNYINFSDLLILKHILWKNFNEKLIVEETLHDTIFGEHNEIKRVIQELRKELDKLDSYFKYEIGKFIFKRDNIESARIEEYFNSNMNLVNEAYKVASVLHSKASELNERIEFNKQVLKECEENMFIYDEERQDLENIKKYIKQNELEYVFPYKKTILNIISKSRVIDDERKKLIEEVLVYEAEEYFGHIKDDILKAIRNFELNPFNFSSIQHSITPEIVSEVGKLRASISKIKNKLERFKELCSDSYSYLSFNPALLS